MIKSLFENKDIKSKERVAQLSALLLSAHIEVTELSGFAAKAKDPVMADCIEALEQATQTKPALINEDTFLLLINSLAHKAPRVKWEAAKTIGNTIHLFHAHAASATTALLANTGPLQGTVVRWSAAYALGRIIELGVNIPDGLLPLMETIMAAEEKNSIKKIYAAALKKIKK